MRKRPLLFVLVFIFFTACQPQSEQPAAEPTAAEVEGTLPTSTALAEATVMASATAVSVSTAPAEPGPAPTTIPTNPPEPTDAPTSILESGRTDEGAYYLGSPGAPIRMIDYSDFM